MIEATGQGSAAKYCPEMVREQQGCHSSSATDWQVLTDTTFVTARSERVSTPGGSRERKRLDWETIAKELIVTRIKSTPSSGEITPTKRITADNNWHLFKAANSLRSTLPLDIRFNQALPLSRSTLAYYQLRGSLIFNQTTSRHTVTSQKRRRWRLQIYRRSKYKICRERTREKFTMQ